MRIQIVILIMATIFITILNISNTEAFSYTSGIYKSPTKNIENISVNEIKYKYCRYQARRSIWGQKRYVTPWARATNNVKKPQGEMVESCRKLDLRFL